MSAHPVRGQRAPPDLQQKIIVVDALPESHIQSANAPRLNPFRYHVRLRLSQSI